MFKKLPHKKLAEGESHGHSHVAVAEDAALFINEAGEMRMEAPSGTTVKHEEHGAVEVPAGTFKVGRVQEYDHAAEAARQVAD